jgi:hypothetical protein
MILVNKWSRTLLSSLLAKGYLPRELPPPFSSSRFDKFARRVGLSWRTEAWTRCVTHNLARPGGLRRSLKIPNPISYFALAHVIAAHWADIRLHTWRHWLSASRPHLMPSSDRAVVGRYRYGELARLRALRWRAGRHLLLTDINQFYPTIYTHSVPWALHTKAFCKATIKSGGKKKSAVLLGDALDRLLQRMNDGQTHGIPIGPDTSLVIAEILLAAADQALVAKGGKAFSGFRYIDDYELSFGSLSAAEETLSDLQAVLASFELSLNPKKTRILDLPFRLDSAWAVDLKTATIRDSRHPVGQRNDLLSLFSRAFDLAAVHPADSVLRYAVARVQGLDVNSSGWRCFHNCVLSAATADPSTLPVALGTLHEVARRGGHAVPKGPLGEVFESVIARHAPRAQGSEVAWALWGALAWSVPLSADSARLVSSMEDDIVALLALDLDAEGLFPKGALNKNIWAAILAQPDALEGEHWLLAYEASYQHWLSTAALAKHKEFSSMAAAKVSFYDKKKRGPQFPKAGKALPGGTLSQYYA